jgi:hypothetical protein
MTPRVAYSSLSKIANTRSAILAPAIAAWEDGCHDLKYRWSPPLKWRYGVIMISSDEFMVNATRRTGSGLLGGVDNHHPPNNDKLTGPGVCRPSVTSPDISAGISKEMLW